jgi:hypothetical protein
MDNVRSVAPCQKPLGTLLCNALSVSGWLSRYCLAGGVDDNRQTSVCSIRLELCSLGQPPIWQRGYLCWFWRGVAAGYSSAVYAVEAVGSGLVRICWFQGCV